MHARSLPAVVRYFLIVGSVRGGMFSVEGFDGGSVSIPGVRLGQDFIGHL